MLFTILRSMYIKGLPIFIPTTLYLKTLYLTIDLMHCKYFNMNRDRNHKCDGGESDGIYQNFYFSVKDYLFFDGSTLTRKKYSTSVLNWSIFVI